MSKGQKQRTGAVTPQVAYVLAIVTGILYFGAFAGFNGWLFALVAFAPLAIGIEDQPVNRCVALGLVTGCQSQLVQHFFSSSACIRQGGSPCSRGSWVERANATGR
jgi:apolipoprotein N-acyltransferase